MSAILGRIEFDHRPVDRAAFDRALGAIGHYGQDCSKLLDNTATLGATALPWGAGRAADSGLAEHGAFRIVADAVLDNRSELCAALGLAGDTGDTALILRAFLQWGLDCVARLEGDFAFAIWNRDDNRLYLARDHIGARPLYWRRSGQSFVFATDIRALKAFDDLDWRIDENMVARFLANANYPLPKTFYDDLNFVPPGTTLTVTPMGETAMPWWTPLTLPDTRFRKSDDYIQAYRDLTERAVRRATAGDIRVGSHFSGGVDSSTVALIAQQDLAARGQSLTGAYPWTPGVSDAFPDAGPTDERRRIDALAELHGIPCRYGAGDMGTATAYFDRIPELDGTADLVDEYPVLQKAGDDGIRVMLTGWGGDEAWSSHGFGYLAWAIRTGRWARALRVNRRYGGGFRNPGQVLGATWTQGILPMLPDALYRRWPPYPDYHGRHGFADPGFLAGLDPQASTLPDDVRWVADPVAYMRAMIGRGHLAARMDTWAVWSAPHGFQYRYPLLNRPLLEFVLGLPPEILFGDGQTRYLVRKAFADLIPKTLGKADPVNETYRSTLRTAGMKAVAGRSDAGAFDDPCPWLDLPAMKRRLTEIKASGGEHTVSDFVEIGAATLVYGLYRRAL